LVTRSTLTQAERRFVLARRVARLATADGTGRPHVVPVCYAFDGARFYIPLDEKPKRVPVDALRRVRNIKSRPEVTLLVDHYEEDWSRLGYVMIHGQAAVLQPGAADHAAGVAALRARYPQYEAMDLESRGVIAIEPRRVVSWGRLEVVPHRAGDTASRRTEPTSPA
jgi:PPOX class probable F420-dependent enzyme